MTIDYDEYEKLMSIELIEQQSLGRWLRNLQLASALPTYLRHGAVERVLDSTPGGRETLEGQPDEKEVSES